MVAHFEQKSEPENERQNLFVFKLLKTASKNSSSYFECYNVVLCFFLSLIHSFYYKFNSNQNVNKDANEQHLRFFFTSSEALQVDILL
jgi:hypothetical protein